jgi:hypothetical protein
MFYRRSNSSLLPALRWTTSLAISIFFLGSLPVKAFEADVHYGLTYWLAVQAGFEPLPAQIIATGDQRVDSGDMQNVDLAAMYACWHKDAVSGRRAGLHHYPSAGKYPGPLEARVVEPNSSAARKAALEVLKINPSEAQFRLAQLGEALHALQDSWANQGLPSLAQYNDAPLACDSGLAWGAPETRGGANSHKADLTMFWSADTVAMAQATYDILNQYPPLSGVQRTPRNWDEVRSELDGFIGTATKTDKALWFAAHGVSDTSFLEGISLPDGSEAFLEHWPNRKLPPLSSEDSHQHAVDTALLDFYNSFFARWLSTEDFAAVVSEFAAPMKGSEELESRLKLWRLRDHGTVAELALQREPLTAEQRARIDIASAKPNAYAQYKASRDAYFPLLPAAGDDVSPLLPFFIGLPPAPSAHSQAIAVTKFRHAPYNVVGIIAEKMNDQWRVKSIQSTVEH